MDCDVIQADGGTRTASITGAYVATALALSKLLKDEVIQEQPLVDQLAAVSVGISQEGEVLLDLCYEEDASAAVDLNVVMTGKGEFVELQGTGEEATFSARQLTHMLEYAEAGISSLLHIQQDVLQSAEARES